MNCHEVTPDDLLRVNAELHEVKAQLATLRQQVKDRGELLRTVSHDLRSSLGVVQGAAQLLNLAESDEERVQIMEMINRNVLQMAQLLTELVTSLPIETDKQPLQ